MGEDHKGLVYLAMPYSHPDAKVRRQRFETVNRLAAKLMAKGMHIFSPISHTHPIAEAGDLPVGWEFWEQYDRTILAVCCALIVVCADGFRQSAGVRAEIEIAKEMGLPITYICVDGQIFSEVSDE
jgi:hypothetical protein